MNGPEGTPQYGARIAEEETCRDLVVHDVINAADVLQMLLYRLITHADGGLSPSQEELLRKAIRQSITLIRVAQEARMVADVKAGVPPRPPLPVELEPLLLRLAADLKDFHFDRPTEVRLVCPSDLHVAGFPMLESVLANLLDNAARHTEPDRPPTMEVDAARGDAGWVRLRITGGTPGCGTRTRKRGVGLSLVQKIVERAGGSIETGAVENPRGKVFQVTLFLPAHGAS